MDLFSLQNKFEEAEYLFNLPADESKPYEHKYAAREILNKLMLNVGAVHDQETRFVIEMIINFHLATNYLETEENSQAEKHFQEVIKILAHLPPKSMQYYLNYLQESYNSLGILLTNRDEVANGLSIFAKAEQLKTVADQMYGVTKCSDIFSSIEYSRLLSDPNNKEKIRFTSYLSGGLNMLRFEKNFTLTIFYMAQAYTKANLKYKAAKYCGDTLKRQFERKEYELKDWCVNCMSLTDYFLEHRQFAQAQYILAAGMSVIPEGKKKKLRASFHMSLVRYLLEFLKFAVEKYRLGQSEEPILKSDINRKTLEFKGVGVDFIELNVPKNYEEMASVFRQLNTQAKKAMQIYVLDGYVTENIQLCRDLSLAYKMLTVIETDPEKILALHERRRELLETPVSEINPKAFENFYQHLSLELGDIYNSLFEAKWAIANQKDAGKGLKKSTIEAMNRYCLNSIKWNQKLVDSMLAQKIEDQSQLLDHHQTIITTKFNIAKSYTRLQGATKPEKIEYLKKGFESYQWIGNYIKDTVTKLGGLTKELVDTLKNCEEMVELLPSKIDHINAEK